MSDLLVKDEKLRRDNLSIWIQVLSQFYSLNNIYLFCTVCKALQSPHVRSLDTWNAISNKYKKLIKELYEEAGNIMSNDFKKIVKWTKSIKAPLVPNLGIYFLSLSQFNEQEPTIIMDPSGDKFNFRKIFKICKNVEKYQKYQETECPYEINNEVMNEFNSSSTTLFTDEELEKMLKEIKEQ